MKSVVLCADEWSLRHPEHIGLEGESLFTQPWLRVFAEAQMAREALAKAQEVEEVWVASNDEVEPINLAAAIKCDRPDRRVFLVSFAASGSLMSRVGTASLDGVLGRAEFVRRYMEWKSADARRAQALMGGAAHEEKTASSVGPMIERAPSTEVMPTGKHAAPSAARHGGKHIGAVRVGAAYPGPGDETPGVYQPPARGGISQRSDIMEQAMMVVQDQVPDSQAREQRAMITSVEDSVQPSAGAVYPPEPTVRIQPGQTFLMPVISGSGGSGKSTIAALSALVAHKAGMKTLLVDLDLQFGDMLEMLGYKEALCVDGLLAVPGRLRQLQAGEKGPALLCAPRNIEQAEDVIAQLPALLDLVMPHFDFVVVNTGSFWTDAQAVLMERCSRALFVVDQRPSSLKACQRALDLCTRCGIAASPMVFAVNKCSKQGLYSSIDVSCALNGACAKELAWGGTQVEEMLAAGQAMELLEMRNDLVESLVVLLQEIVPQMPEVDLGESAVARMSLLRMLMGRNREEQPCR